MKINFYIKLKVFVFILGLTNLNLINANELLEYPKVINFDIASKDDKFIFEKLEIKNKSKLPIRFDRYIILNDEGKPSQTFRFDPPNQLPPNGMPFDLIANTEYEFRLLADLQKANIGLNRGFLRFFNDRINDSIEIKLNLVMSRDSIIIQIPQLTQKLNDTFNLPILIRGSKVSPNIDAVNITLQFNQTILTPLNPEERGKIENGTQIIKQRFEINKEIRDKNTDTLGFIPMIVMLGNSIYSDIEVTQVEWLRNNITIPKVPTLQINGLLTINDIFFDDGVPRLLSFNNEFMLIKSFSIISGKVNLELEFMGSIPNIQLFDYLGNLIFNNEELSKSIVTSQNKSTNINILNFEFDFNNINSSLKHNNLLYFLSLNNNNSIISKKLVILN